MKHFHKKAKILLLAILGFFLAQEASAQFSTCYASFYYVAQARKITFFDYYSFPDSGATISSYDWDFGDGSTGSGDTAVHTYQNSGYYNVSLQITTTSGCTNSFTYTIGVSNTPQCYATFSSSNVGLTTTFYNYSWPGKGFISCSWDFGDGNTSTDFEPSHTYAQQGIYDVVLNTTDLTTGCQSTITVKTYVYDCTNYTADFTSSVDTANKTISLDASASGITSSSKMYWTFGDGQYEYPGNAVTSHQYATDGIYTVYLSAWDTTTNCYAYASQTFIIGTPTCSAYFYAYPYSTDGLTQYFYSYSVNVDSNTTYSWDFGDGSTGTGLYTQHVYASYGKYNACLTITNTNFNCNDTYCYDIAVYNPSTCVATFIDSAVSTYDIQFINTSGTSASTSYYWDFGDGGSSTDENPLHTYNNPGQFVVYFTYYDTSSTCQAATYKYVNVNSLCQADFTYTVDTAKRQVTFTNTSTSSGSGMSFSWDFGDGNTSNKENPVHAYQSDGIYYVNLYLYDQTNGCSAYGTHVVVVGNKSCVANFSQYLSYDDTITFYGYGQPYYTNFDYSWDFGDGTSGTGAYVRHRYASTGTYNVCLTISDSSCSDTYCTDVDYQHVNTMYGYVYCGSDYMQPARVWAISYDSTAGTLTAVDSVDIDSTGYYFMFTLPAGNYLLKAALKSTSSKYADYLPTYYTSVLRWDSATNIDLSINIGSLNINMIKGQNSGGTGFIGGLVSQGANKTNAIGDPLGHIQVMLMDANHNPIAYTHSDPNGRFKFDNLSYGGYYVMADVLGKTTGEMMVPLSTSMPSTDDVHVDVNSKNVEISMGSNGVKPIDVNLFGLYPNPSQGNVQISGDVSRMKSITVLTMDGRQVWKETMNNGTQRNAFDLSWTSAGMYLIILEGQDGSSSRVRWVKY